MHSNKKLCLIVIALVILTFFYYINIDSLLIKHNKDEFENILYAKVKPKHGRNVFFLETDELTEKVNLNPRQACAIESAALANPHLKVFLLFSSQKRIQALKKSSQVKAILSYPNVFINYLNLEEVSENSPLEEFIKSEKLSKSKFKIEHMSDVLRFLLLWKFGGNYLDMDTIVRKNLDLTPPNFACRQSADEINGAILNFDLRHGRKISEMFINDLIQNFNGDFFVSNGPKVLTRVVKNLCQTSDIDQIVKMKSCQRFNILNTTFCYEIAFSEWKKFMVEKYSEEVMKRVEPSIVVHFWNHESRKFNVEKDSSAAYVKLAKQFCPKVIQSVEKYF